MRRICFILCLVILLTGCGANTDQQNADPSSAAAQTTTLPQELTQSPTESTTLPQDPTVSPTETEPQEVPPVLTDAHTVVLDALRNKLEEDVSFEITFEYMNIAFHGIKQETVQEYAWDGSFCFKNLMKKWDHTLGYEFEEKAEYYYCYEGDSLLCYMRFNEEAPTKMRLSSEDKAEMDASRKQMIGAQAVLPDYLEDFSLVSEDSETGCLVYAFSIPLDQVLSDDIYLSSFVRYMLQMRTPAYEQIRDLRIGGSVKLDKASMTPMEVSFSFEELKPYVLTESSISAEYALESNFVSMIYRFDFELSQTIVIPDEFLP